MRFQRQQGVRIQQHRCGARGLAIVFEADVETGQHLRCRTDLIL